jgi:hypothetical protein
MNDTHDAAGIGHNSPPPTTIGERLAVNYSTLIETVEAIAQRANVAPRKIESDEDLDVICALVKDASALFRQAEKYRETEKAEYLRAGQQVDAWFRAQKDRLDRIASVFQGIADAHAEALRQAELLRQADERRRAAEEAQRLRDEEDRMRKADDLAERAEVAEMMAEAPKEVVIPPMTTAGGTVVNAKTEFIATSIDVETLNFGPLRFLIKYEAIEAAVKQFIKNGGRALAGVKIEEKAKAKIR